MAGRAGPGGHSDRFCHLCLFVQLQEGLGGGCYDSKGGVPSGHTTDPLAEGAWKPQSTLHLLPVRPPEGAQWPAPWKTTPTPDISSDRAAAKETPLSLGPSGNPIRHPEQVQAGGWVGQDGRIWLGPRWAGEVVSSQLFSPQVRRILIPWTERQTDRQIPTPPSALLSWLPRGFLPKSLWRSRKEVWPQAPGPGEGEAWALPLHPHRSLYLQGHPNTDTYKYTPSMHTCP